RSRGLKWFSTLRLECIQKSRSSDNRLQWQREMPPMQVASLTFKEMRARPVVLELKRPVVARIATITEWPLILIDLFTEEGVVGRSYLEPYLIKAMRYLIPALHDLASIFKGRRIAPLELYDSARKSLHFV